MSGEKLYQSAAWHGHQAQPVLLETPLTHDHSARGCFVLGISAVLLLVLALSVVWWVVHTPSAPAAKPQETPFLWVDPATNGAQMYVCYAPCTISIPFQKMTPRP